MNTLIDFRTSRIMAITETLSIIFDPVQCKDGTYKSRDPLSVNEIVKLIASRGELKNVHLHITGCIPMVDLKTATLLATMANASSHKMQQHDIPDETNWEIGVLWQKQKDQEDHCRFLLQMTY